MDVRKLILLRNYPLLQIRDLGFIPQEQEETGDEDNINVINENERITSVFLEIPFLVNQNDRDGDGVIDALDIDPDDNQSDTDGDWSD